MIFDTDITLIGLEEAPAGTSRYGDPEYEPDEGTDVPAHVEPLDATEEEVNRNTRLNRYRVTVALEAEVDGLSTVQWNGKTYEVQGEPALFGGYRGPHHLEFEMRGVVD